MTRAGRLLLCKLFKVSLQENTSKTQIFKTNRFYHCIDVHIKLCPRLCGTIE